MLLFQRLLQTAWLLASLPFVYRGMVHREWTRSIFPVTVWLAICVGTALLYANRRIGLHWSGIPAGAAAAIVALAAVVNFGAFLRGAELYRDSPATIVVVGIYAFVVGVPPGRHRRARMAKQVSASTS